MSKNPSQPHATLGEGKQKSHHLFVVDDDEFVRKSLARRLRRKGFVIQEFESGELVVGYLNHAGGLPDAIILDFKMTGLNGLETAKLIRQRSPYVPIILLSAYPGAINIEEAECEGVFEILTKNIDLENLQEVIHHAIQRQQQ